MTATPLESCPRCEHANRVKARYCARCGLDLGKSSAKPKSGIWLAVGLVVLGVSMGLFALVMRTKPTRALPLNLWNKPQAQELPPRNRKPHSKHALPDPSFDSFDDDETLIEEHTIIEYHSSGPYHEVVE